MLQVLNMKPPEILGMLEEAAGTRMYESKKDSALRTLEKKQIKVEEINKVRPPSLVAGINVLSCHVPPGLGTYKRACMLAVSCCQQSGSNSSEWIRLNHGNVVEM